MAILRLSNLQKIYNNCIVALNDINLEVYPNDFFVLVGPSGCGKSTMLLLIAGLEDITSGDVFIDDVCVNDVDSKDRGIAMVFQDYTLYPHLTVRDNLAFPLKMKHTPVSKIAEKIQKISDLLMFDDLLNRKPHHLSGGQKQRVAFGKALIQNPRIFLMDEPFANLDTAMRNQMCLELSLLHKRIEAAIVYVTHDQEEALALGTRICVINHGNIQQIGTPETVYQHPKNTFVASFIGRPAMNLLEQTELLLDDGEYYIVIDEYTIKIGETLQKKLHQAGIEPKPVITGIRPEDIYISEKCMFPAIIQFIEYVGSSQRIHVKTGERTLILSEQTKAKRQAGEKVSLCFKHENLYVFDKVTHMNLDYIE